MITYRIKNILKRILPCVLALAVTVLSACSEQKDSTMRKFTTYRYFNTYTEWSYSTKELSETQAEAIWGQIKEVLDGVEKSISTEVTDSAVSRFNRAKAGEEIELDNISYAIFSLAKELHAKTGGAYNPAIGLLIDLWGFSPRFHGTQTLTEPYVYDRAIVSDAEGSYLPLPSEEYRSAFSTKEVNDFSAVEIIEREGKYFAKKPKNAFVTVDEITYTMQLNFGGIGKGYCVDGVVELLQNASLTYGYFSLGGSSMHVLQNPDEDTNGVWSVDIRNPRPNLYQSSTYSSVKQTNCSLSSSGDYENYYVLDGKRYCHIINPLEGYPVNTQPSNLDGSGIVAVSVFGLSAAEGDATTTALMAMTKEDAIAYIGERLGQKDAVFLYYDGMKDKYGVYTTMPQQRFTLDNTDWEIVTLNGN